MELKFRINSIKIQMLRYKKSQNNKILVCVEKENKMIFNKNNYYFLDVLLFNLYKNVVVIVR